MNIQIIEKYLVGTATSSEVQLVENWLVQHPDHIEQLIQVSQRLFNNLNYHDEEVNEVSMENALLKFTSRRKELNKEGSIKPNLQKLGGQKCNFRNAGIEYVGRWAAAFLVIALIGVSIFFAREFDSSDSMAFYEEIELSKSSSVEFGQISTIFFPDGSTVVLNGGSEITYPENFSSDKREVNLTGEAYFSVKSDVNNPFIVNTPDAQVTVLGTSFNVHAYQGDDVVVAVESGEVSFNGRKETSESLNGDESVLLTANEWIRFNKSNGKLKVSKGDIDDFFAWKDRRLVFRKKTFVEVVDLLEKWYGVEIVVESNLYDLQILEGEHRGHVLEDVLESMQIALGFEFKIEGRKVYISEK